MVRAKEKERYRYSGNKIPGGLDQRDLIIEGFLANCGLVRCTKKQ